VSDSTWTEGGLTYNNAPAIGNTTPTISSGALTANSWKAINVSSLVSGNGVVNLALKRTSTSSINVSSSEGANPPVLVVVTQEQGAATVTPVPPTPTSTPPTGESTFIAEADSYAQADRPTTNFGSAATLKVDASPATHSYLRFTVQGLNGTVTNASLYIYATTQSTKGYEVRGVSDNNWQETTLTYNNMPARGAVVGTSGALTAGSWSVVPVTVLVAGNGAINLALTGTSSTSISFSSSEGTQPPRLVVTTSGGGQGAAAESVVIEEPLGLPEIDSDGDGLSDADELANGTNLSLADSDGDGLPDLWEVEGGLSATNDSGDDGAEGDPDGDGISNLDEYNGRTDPRVPEGIPNEIPAGELFLPLISGK
jgi:hypothetical protein